jgi:hypothetical protein
VPVQINFHFAIRLARDPRIGDAFIESVYLWVGRGRDEDCRRKNWGLQDLQN